MSNLPGNPHADAAYIAEVTLHYDAPEQLLAAAQVEATMALAYEQRTANMIATQAMGVTDMTGWPPEHAAAWHARAVEVAERMGFEATK